MKSGLVITIGLATVALWAGFSHPHREALWRWNHGEPRCTLHAMDRLGL